MDAAKKRRYTGQVTPAGILESQDVDESPPGKWESSKTFQFLFYVVLVVPAPLEQVLKPSVQLASFYMFCLKRKF